MFRLLRPELADWETVGIVEADVDSDQLAYIDQVVCIELEKVSTSLLVHHRTLQGWHILVNHYEMSLEALFDLTAVFWIVFGGPINAQHQLFEILEVVCG